MKAEEREGAPCAHIYLFRVKNRKSYLTYNSLHNVFLQRRKKREAEKTEREAGEKAEAEAKVLREKAEAEEAVKAAATAKKQERVDLIEAKKESYI